MNHFVIPSVILVTGLVGSVGIVLHSLLRGKVIANRSGRLRNDRDPAPNGPRVSWTAGNETSQCGELFSALWPSSKTRRRSGNNRTKVVTGWCGISLFLVLGVLISHPRILGVPTARTVADLVQSLAALAAAALCFYADFHRRHGVRRASSKGGWFFLGIACGCWGAGQLIWTWLEIVKGENVPFPSYADIGYLLALPFTSLALIIFRPTSTGAASRLRALFDGLIITLSLFGIAWSTVLGPFIFETDQSWVKRILSIIYPFVDVVNCSIALAAIARSRMRGLRSLICVAIGLGFLTVADSMFLYLTQENSYQTGSWIDLGWVGSFVAVGFGAAISAETLETSTPPVSISLWRAALPYGALGFAVLAAVLRQVLTGSVGSFVFFDGVIILCLIMLRQLALILESIRIGQSLEKLAVAAAETTSLREVSEELRIIRAAFGAREVSAERLDEAVEKLDIVTHSNEAYRANVVRLAAEVASVAKLQSLDR